MLNEMKERWTAYINNDITSPEIKPYILESWERCRKMDVNHLSGYGSKVSASELEESILKRQELIKLSRPIMENVFEMVKSTNYSVVLTDEKASL